MNKIFPTLLVLCCFKCISQDLGQLEKLKSRFEPRSIPFNSAFLNENSSLIKISKKRPLSEDEILRYILAGHRSKLEYRFEKYDMETGESKGFETRSYKFYPVYRIEYKELLILVVLRTSANTQSYFLSVYNTTNEKTSEAIEINKLDAEDEYRLFQCSYLDESLQLRIFRYEINPRYLKNLKTEPDKSIVTETNYEIAENVKLVGRKSRHSHCSVVDFYEKNRKCADEDPMKNLPSSNPSN